MTQYESYGIIIFLILVITPLDGYIIQPIFAVGRTAVMDLFHFLLGPIL
jgi:hypothetical protein